MTQEMPGPKLKKHTKQPGTQEFSTGDSGLVTVQKDPSLEDLLSPEPLSEALLKDLEPVLIVIDQYHVECLFSKQWQLRDKGLLHLEKQIQSQCTIESLPTFRAIVKVLLRALNDKVANVFQTSLQVLRSFVKRYSAEVSNKEILSAATDIIIVLVEKLGHSNVRTREATIDNLFFLATTKEIGLNIVAPYLLKAPKTQATWKPVFGRLRFLLVAIPTFGLQPQSPVGFSVEALMSFITQSFGSPNGEVRNAAVRVTIEAYKLMGPPLEKFLKGVRPAIREVLIENFEKVSNDIQQNEKIKVSSSPCDTTLNPHKKTSLECNKNGDVESVEDGSNKAMNCNITNEHLNLAAKDCANFSQEEAMPKNSDTYGPVAIDLLEDNRRHSTNMQASLESISHLIRVHFLPTMSTSSA